jgi:hypothetical protein
LREIARLPAAADDSASVADGFIVVIFHRSTRLYAFRQACVYAGLASFTLVERDQPIWKNP